MKEFAERRLKLQIKMKESGIRGFLIAQNVDLYYLTGTMQTGYLFVPDEGDAVYYVRRSMTRALAESDVAAEELGSMRSLAGRLGSAFPAIFRTDGEKPRIAAEFDVLPVQLYQRLAAAVPGADWVDGSAMLREIRMIKSPGEIAVLKEAARVTDLALEKAAAYVKEGMPEYELMGIIEHTMRVNGHMGLMRMRGFNQEMITGMVGAGAAAAAPTYFDGPAGGEGLGAASPQSSGRRRIGRNEPILVDIGCCIDGYVFDQTRTLAIGALDGDLTAAYEWSERILRSSEATLKPGTVCEDLYLHALEQAESAGLGDHFMGYGIDQVKFLGHGIGLEIDELPVLARGFRYRLEPGMVIAIEPKFTFPGRGVVGIENTYAITETGFEKLSVSREGIILATGG